MSDSLRGLDLSQLNVDDATRQLLQRLLNHIETLEAENQALRDEIQQLRDEIARLKGQKPKPQFKANRPAGDAAGTPPQQRQAQAARQQPGAAGRTDSDQSHASRATRTQPTAARLPSGWLSRGGHPELAFRNRYCLLPSGTGLLGQHGTVLRS